jgi:hypothetical protein
MVIEMGHKRETIFTCVYIRKIFSKLLSQNSPNSLGSFGHTCSPESSLLRKCLKREGVGGSGRATIGKITFACIYRGKIFKYILLKNH